MHQKNDKKITDRITKPLERHIVLHITNYTRRKGGPAEVGGEAFTRKRIFHEFSAKKRSYRRQRVLGAEIEKKKKEEGKRKRGKEETPEGRRFHLSSPAKAYNSSWKTEGHTFCQFQKGKDDDPFIRRRGEKKKVCEKGGGRGCGVMMKKGQKESNLWKREKLGTIPTNGASRLENPA